MNGLTKTLLFITIVLLALSVQMGAYILHEQPRQEKEIENLVQLTRTLDENLLQKNMDIKNQLEGYERLERENSELRQKLHITEGLMENECD